MPSRSASLLARSVPPLRMRGRGAAGELLAVALLIRAGSAGLAMLFRWLIGTFTLLFTGH